MKFYKVIILIMIYVNVKEGDIVANICSVPFGICFMLYCKIRNAKIISIDIKDEYL